MQAHHRAFIEFALENKALLFGEFITKSGRKTPYFFNMGCFNTGKAIAKLGEFYATAIQYAAIEYDVLFGPAYKGIPLVTATAIALANKFAVDKPYCFNRKEPKDHGEGGDIVGAPLAGRVLMVDDVISAGVTVREAVSIVGRAKAELTAIMIAVDRQEKGVGQQSAIMEVAEEFGVPVFSIIQLSHVLAYLKEQGEHARLDRMLEYRQQYGV